MGLRLCCALAQEAQPLCSASSRVPTGRSPACAPPTASTTGSSDAIEEPNLSGPHRTSVAAIPLLGSMAVGQIRASTTDHLPGTPVPHQSTTTPASPARLEARRKQLSSLLAEEGDRRCRSPWRHCTPRRLARHASWDRQGVGEPSRWPRVVDLVLLDRNPLAD